MVQIKAAFKSHFGLSLETAIEVTVDNARFHLYDRWLSTHYFAQGLSGSLKLMLLALIVDDDELPVESEGAAED